MPLRYIVPDTCAVAASLYNEAHSLATTPMLEAIRQRTVDAVAPALGLVEFLNVSRRKLAGSTLSQAAVDTAVADLLSLPITWVDVEPYAAEAWRLHTSYGVETGDAFFLAVAIEFSAEIWTTDTQFTASARPLHADIYDLKVSPWK